MVANETFTSTRRVEKTWDPVKMNPLPKHSTSSNPDPDNFTYRWKYCGGFEDVDVGNDGQIEKTARSIFAIIAWPATRHLENVTNFMSADLAVEELASRRPVEAAALRNLLDKAATKYGWGEVFTFRRTGKAPVRFCRSFCELLLESDNLELTKLFITKYCPRLGFLADNSTLIPVMAKIARTFAWSDIGVALMDILGTVTCENTYNQKRGDSDMEMLLLVAGGLDDGVAKQALINAAMAKEDYVLRSREAIEVLWDTVRLGDKQTFDMVMKKIQTMDPPELGQFAKVFSRFINDYDEVRVPIRAVVQKVIAAKQAGGRPTKKRRT